VGRRCVASQIGKRTAVFLWFAVADPGDDTNTASGAKVLGVVCPWRIEHGPEVLLGSGSVHLADVDAALADDAWADEALLELDPEFGVILARLVGQTVTSVAISMPSYMSQVHFSDGYVLWIFPDASTYGDAHHEGIVLPWFIFEPTSTSY
jgi:hypothetical protein